MMASHGKQGQAPDGIDDALVTTPFPQGQELGGSASGCSGSSAVLLRSAQHPDFLG